MIRRIMSQDAKNKCVCLNGLRGAFCEAESCGNLMHPGQCIEG